MYYAGKRWLSAKDDRLLEIGGKYHYNFFVFYAESEKQLFIPNLRLMEENLDLRFCIHSRDFMPGVIIHENVETLFTTVNRPCVSLVKLS